MNKKGIRAGKLHSSSTNFRITDDKSHDVFTAQDFALMMREYKRKRDMPPPDRNAPRKAMVVAVPISLIIALKKHSYKESIRLGRRVTQQEVVESALRAFLYEQ